MTAFQADFPAMFEASRLFIAAFPYLILFLIGWWLCASDEDASLRKKRAARLKIIMARTYISHSTRFIHPTTTTRK